MIAIAKYPQYPYPYLIIFVNLAKEIVMDTIIIKADTIILFFTGFSTFFKTRIFSKLATNPNVVVTAVEIKQSNKQIPYTTTIQLAFIVFKLVNVGRVVSP